MKEVVNNEVAEFMKFAQNAAKSCTQDYDSISEDALRYTEVIIEIVIKMHYTLPVGCKVPRAADLKLG
mgnify:CR=1 FL=1